MDEKREISARSFVKDVRSGMAVLDLMKRYKLTQKGLRSVLRKLVRAKVMTKAEINSRAWLTEDIAVVSGLRRFPRTEIKFPLLVCPADEPAKKGFVKDISPKGLAVEGIKASVGESQKLRIRSNELVDSNTFEFQVQCRWTRDDRETEEEDLAGFEITDISTGAFAELEKILRR